VGPEGEPDVFVADEQAAVAVDLDRWRRLALGVLVAEGVRGNAELSVLFVGEDAIADLNRQFMGADGPTDVLSFPIDGDDVDISRIPDPATTGPDRPEPDADDIPLLLGDVVVCPSVAARQAPTHAGTLDDELALLVVHGVLHVLGHDHAGDDDTARMRDRERALLEALHWHGPAPAGFRQDHA